MAAHECNSRHIESSYVVCCTCSTPTALKSRQFNVSDLVYNGPTNTPHACPAHRISSAGERLPDTTGSMSRNRFLFYLLKLKMPYPTHSEKKGLSRHYHTGQEEEEKPPEQVRRETYEDKNPAKDFHSDKWRNIWIQQYTINLGVPRICKVLQNVFISDTCNLTPTFFSLLRQTAKAVTLRIRGKKHHQTLLTELIFVVQYCNNKLCSVAI